MLANTTRVLLVLSQDVLDQARVVAGKTTSALKLPVSLQVVLRALLEVGLRRENHAALVASVESQAKAVHQRRRWGGRGGRRDEAGAGPVGGSAEGLRGVSSMRPKPNGHGARRRLPW
jgi:hypothetical protein